MPNAAWQLNATSARFALGQLAAEVNPAAPRRGLHAVEWHHRKIGVAQILGVELQPIADAIADAHFGDTPNEIYVRQHDLIASYGECAGRPYSPQVYWRGLIDERPAAKGGSVGVELVVAVHTSRLDSQPRLATISQFPAVEILRLVDVDRGMFSDTVKSDDSAGEPSGTASRCWLVRLIDSPLSYVEMVHPLDAQHARPVVKTVGQQVTLRQELIHRWLEKGVLVRARVRGWLLDRADDTASAARLYRDFAASPLPLTA